MGNCHKSRLCQFVHNHCRFLFFGRYESIFNHNDHTSTGSNQTTTSNLNYHNNNCDFHHQQPQTTIGNHHYQGYSAQYGGGSAATVLSGNSKTQSALVANCSKGGNSNNNGSTATTMANNSQQQTDYKMHRQRSASHCPHQIRSDNVSPAARKCCCRKPKSSGSGGGGTTSRSKSNSKSNSDHTSDPAFGRSKSLRLLNKRFNFFQEANKDPRRNSNASSAATTTATCRQPTSATYHHGSSANHQIIYHSNNILTRNSKKQKHHHPKLNELDDRSLTHVFEYLTLKERMLFERVCRRWQCLIRTSLLAPASLKIGEHSVKCNCQCAYFPSWDLPPGKRFPRDEGGYIIYPSKLLEYLLGLCRNLKCINFSHCYLDDKTLQVIMTYSETVECLHLNDIKLEEGNEEDCDLSSPSNSASNDPASTSNNRTAHSSDELLSNGHHQSEENTVTSAVSAFATEQLAVFNGLMRKLSTRKPGKKEKAQPNGVETTVNTSNSGMSNSNQKYVVKQANGNYQTYQAMQMQPHRHSGTSINLQISNQSTRRIMADHELDRSLKITRSSPSPSPAKGSGTQITQIGGSGRPARKSTDPVVGLHYKLGHGNLSYPNITTTAASIVTSDISTNICITPKVINNSPTTTNYMYNNMMMNKPCDHEGSKLSLTENSSTNATGTPLNGPGSGKNSNSNIASAVTKEVLSNAIGQRRAQQRRREWSRHRSSQNQNHLQLLQQQQQIMMQQNQQNNNDTSNEEDPLSSSPNMEALANQNNNNNNTVTTNTNNTNTNNTNTNNSLGNDDSNSKDSSSAAKRHLMSPNVAPNISSLQTDSDGVRFTSHSNSNSSNGSSGSNASVTGVVGTGNVNRSRAQPSDNPNRPNARQNGRFSSHPATSANQNSVDNALAISRFDDIQAFVEQEQRRRETRQSHLTHWKNFSKKLGAQVKSLSIGGLTSVDQVVIDLLLKYCVALDELRINNEIDILSYLTIIKHTVKKIYINCEHGIGLECVSLLAFRNYSEKVVKLGRVDVPPELIDSVISTIGSNFSNLKSLHIRLSHQDIDVSTPANLLFDNLYELNLQFCNTSNINQSVCDDLPFKKIIQLGWSSVESLTIQYASITDDAVKAIGENMPQLKKLFLTAVEFKCDHIGKRYGHRICNICSHSVWKCIATLPHLTQLKLFRVIIDPEICKAISRMSRLTTLDLHYCSNVSDNILTVCTELAKRNPKRRFMLGVVSRRGFLNFSPPPDCHNLFIEVKVVEVERS